MFSRFNIVLALAKCLLLALSASGSPATSIDPTPITASYKTAVERITLYNTALETVNADYAAVVAAVAKYNASRQSAIVAREAALEAMLSISSTAVNLHDAHALENLPGEILLDGEVPPAPDEEEITPEPAVLRVKRSKSQGGPRMLIDANDAWHYRSEADR